MLKLSLYQRARNILESGALDHSAILTVENWLSYKKRCSSHLGIEPRTFGLEVQRAILCANGTHLTYTYFISHDTYGPLAQLVRASC